MVYRKYSQFYVMGVTYVQKGFWIRTLIKQIWIFFFFFLRNCPKFHIFTKIIFLKVQMEIDQLLPA